MKLHAIVTDGDADLWKAILSELKEDEKEILSDREIRFSPPGISIRRLGPKKVVCYARSMYGHVPSAGFPVGFVSPGKYLARTLAQRLNEHQGMKARATVTKVDASSFGGEVRWWLVFLPFVFGLILYFLLQL